MLAEYLSSSEEEDGDAFSSLSSSITSSSQLDDRQPPLEPVSSATPSVVTCASCSSSATKYCCPACSAVSCSLPCVLAHKQRTGCTGKRPRSSYLPLPVFTSSQLQHDLFFLEEVAREAGGSARHPLLRGRTRKEAAGEEAGGAGTAFASSGATGHYAALQRECVRRGIRLLLMSAGMSRHELNSSRAAGNGRLQWRIEWLLDAHQMRIAQQRVDGSVSWMQALTALLTQADTRGKQSGQPAATVSELRQTTEESKESLQTEERKEAEIAEAETAASDTRTDAAASTVRGRVFAHHSDLAVRRRLQEYAGALCELRLFIRVPMTAAKDTSYYTISPQSAINDSLVGLTILEFPTVHVVFPADAAAYRDWKTPPTSQPDTEQPQQQSQQSHSEPQRARTEEAMMPTSSSLSSLPPPPPPPAASPSPPFSAAASGAAFKRWQ